MGKFNRGTRIAYGFVHKFAIVHVLIAINVLI